MSYKTSAVLLAILSMTWPSFGAPPYDVYSEDYLKNSGPHLDSDSVSGEAEPLGPGASATTRRHIEFEHEMNSLQSHFQQSNDVSALEYMDWIRRERVTLARSRQLCAKIQSYFPRSELWTLMEFFAEELYTLIKTSQPNLSLSAQMSLAFNRELIPNSRMAATSIRQKIQLWFDEEFGPGKSLTKSLLNLVNSPLLSEKNEPLHFKSAISTAIKYDARKGLLTDAALRDIARSFFRIGKMYKTPETESLKKIIESSSAFRKHFTDDQIEILLDETTTMNLLGDKPTEALANRWKHWGTVNLKPDAQRNDRKAHDRRSKYFSCEYMQLEGRRRRNASDCLITEEEYRKVMKTVEKDGNVKEIVLNTEKFLELLDRTTAENSSAKREQLLELAEALWEDPRVSLEGDNVKQFIDIVRHLDETVPSEMLDLPSLDLPENRFGEALPPSEIPATPLDHMSPAEIHLQHLVDSRAYPPKISHEPINIHKPVIYPGEFRRLIYQPKTEFQPMSQPVIIEIIIPNVPILPEVGLPILKSRVPMIRRE